MIDASCSSCQARYRLPETQAGKRVRCKKCGETFAVEAPMEDLPVLEEAAPVLEEAEAPAASLRSGSPPRSRRRDEEEDRPRPRRRDRDEEDDEDFANPPAGGGGTGLVIMAILGVLLVLGGIGGAIAYFVASSGPAPDPVAENKPEANPGVPAIPFPVVPPGGNIGGIKPPVFNPPVFIPPVVVKPIDNVDDALAALRDAEVRRKEAGLDFLAKAPRDQARLAEVVAVVKPLFRDSKLRGRAVKVAGQWTAPELRDELLALGREKDVFLVWAVIESLGSYDDDKVMEALGKHLLNVHVKAQAAQALKKLGKKAEKHVLPYLNSKDFFARGEAESLLASFGTTEEAKRAQMVKDLAREDGVERGNIVKYFLKHKPDPEQKEEQEAVSKALAGLMDDRNPFFKEEVWRAMEHWATPESIPAIVKALGERGFGKKDPLIAALGRMKDERAIAALRDLLATRDHREAAAKALIAAGPKAEPVVLPLLGSTVPDVANAAVVILSEVGGKDTEQALTALARRLPPRNTRGRAIVAAALAKIKARMK